MAEFPPNLEDGELWLPSDIFLNEVPSKYNPYRISCMEDFAGHFAALSLLQNHSSPTPSRPHPKSPLNSQRFKIAVRELSASHLPPVSLGVNGGAELGQRLNGYGSGPLLARSEPFHEFQVQPQVDSYPDTTLRVCERQRNPPQIRLHPFPGSGFGFRGGGGGGGGVRESGGTGVFHPRIVNPTTASPATTDVKRKQVVRSRAENQVNQQRNSMKSPGVNKQEDCYYHLPPEMGLPHDWTY
ncbi:uncharacterized protein LOC110623635 [Manihot esculenta]|uniref:Uncharacterized protein n=1 Tax=Manihot esculenta TaxID=3983 RepID=A0A2C9V940_MANES|nr:uncharacterized protein LOC110623635 [Manihot esculenta]OAY40734.1 hypothetical protein MANES_09G044800v8 [Manihot esculenta]